MTALRPWQQRALASILVQFNDPKHRVLVAACPGSGKTLLGLTVAYEMFRALKAEVALIVCPTKIIRDGWHKSACELGLESREKVDNETFRFFSDRPGAKFTKQPIVIPVTYGQLASSPDLFEELFRRHPSLFICDEIHHADDQRAFGAAVKLIAERAAFRLALSGTPFNSEGGALAMCEYRTLVDETTGRQVNQVIADKACEFSYADALTETNAKGELSPCCRHVQFITIHGQGMVERRSLISEKVWTHVVNTAAARRGDSLGPLLDPDGEFVRDALAEGIEQLQLQKKQHRRAAMLVVGRDILHAKRLTEILNEMIRKRGLVWRVERITEDTGESHKKIAQFRHDGVDVIVSVLMVSEGADIPRLRVGVYLTDILTRMYFLQFVGRFIRIERDLKENFQIAVVIQPAHVLLMEYARELQKMILESLQVENSNSITEPPPSPEPSEVTKTETKSGERGSILTGEFIGMATLDEALPEIYRKVPVLKECVLNDHMAYKLFRGFAAAFGIGEPDAPKSPSQDRHATLRKQYNAMVRQLGVILRRNGSSNDDVFAQIHRAANNRFNNAPVNDLTPTEEFQKRIELVRGWLRVAYEQGEVVL